MYCWTSNCAWNSDFLLQHKPFIPFLKMTYISQKSQQKMPSHNIILSGAYDYQFNKHYVWMLSLSGSVVEFRNVIPYTLRLELSNPCLDWWKSLVWPFVSGYKDSSIEQRKLSKPIWNTEIDRTGVLRWFKSIRWCAKLGITLAWFVWSWRKVK